MSEGMTPREQGDPHNKVQKTAAGAGGVDYVCFCFMTAKAYVSKR